MDFQTKEIVLDRILPRFFGISGLGKYACPFLLLIGDYMVLLAALLSAWYIREGIALLISPVKSSEVPARMLFIDIPLVYAGFALYEGLYNKRTPFWQGAQKVVKVCFFSLLIIILGLFFTKTIDDVPRIFILISFFTCSIYLSIGRYLMKRMIVRAGIWQRPVVVIGAGKAAELLAKSLEDDPNMGYMIAGFIEDCKSERPLMNKYPHLGCFADAKEIIQRSGICDVFIAVPGMTRERLLDLIYSIQPCVKNLGIVPDLFGIPLTNMEAATFINEKTVLLRIRNNMMYMQNQFMKRLFDVFFSLTGILLLFPVFIVIAFIIYIDSPGPIVFAHRRIGKNGEPFSCYKFRTMVADAQVKLDAFLIAHPEAKTEWEREFKLKNDPRITRIGNFLRKTSLDELPQLFNVVTGEMSLVGPRPIIDKEVPKYGGYINDYRLVNPGITGYWQVSGRNDVDYDTRVQMDSWYVRNWSLWLDVVLLIKTVKVVLIGKGAY